MIFYWRGEYSDKAVIITNKPKMDNFFSAVRTSFGTVWLNYDYRNVSVILGLAQFT
jgi:hypothetical protein